MTIIVVKLQSYYYLSLARKLTKTFLALIPCIEIEPESAAYFLYFVPWKTLFNSEGGNFNSVLSFGVIFAVLRFCILGSWPDTTLRASLSCVTLLVHLASSPW